MKSAMILQDHSINIRCSVRLGGQCSSSSLLKGVQSETKQILFSQLAPLECKMLMI